MSKYKALKNLYIGGKEMNKGGIYELSDKEAKALGSGEVKKVGSGKASTGKETGTIKKAIKKITKSKKK